VSAGSSVQFSVTASGRPSVTYQWSFNGTPINGATNSSYGLSNAQSGNAGSYSVVVSNAMGSITSNVATLTVNTAGGADASGGGGGGGGGSPSMWFCSALLLLAAVRNISDARRMKGWRIQRQCDFQSEELETAFTTRNQPRPS